MMILVIAWGATDNMFGGWFIIGGLTLLEGFMWGC